MAKFNVFNRNFALLLTIIVAAQTAHCIDQNLNEDEYVSETIKANAPELVPHMIGAGSVNLQKVAEKTEMTPLEMDDIVPGSKKTVLDGLADEAAAAPNAAAKGVTGGVAAGTRVTAETVAQVEKTDENDDNDDNDDDNNKQ